MARSPSGFDLENAPAEPPGSERPSGGDPMRTAGVIGIVVVALVVLTAGCSGFDETEDREPYDTEVEIEPKLGPGLTERGITDRGKFAAAHRDTLENASYRAIHQFAVRYANGSLVRKFEKTMAVAHANQAGFVELNRVDVRPEVVDPRQRSSGETNRQRWWNGTAEYTRLNESGNVRYWTTQRRVPPRPLFPSTVPYRVDAAGAVSIERDNGTERYRLEADDRDFDGAANASLEIVVHEDGYVESYRYEGELRDDEVEDRLLVDETVTVERSDEVDLEAPDWLAEATGEPG